MCFILSYSECPKYFHVLSIINIFLMVFPSFNSLFSFNFSLLFKMPLLSNRMRVHRLLNINSILFTFYILFPLVFCLLWFSLLIFCFCLATLWWLNLSKYSYTQPVGYFLNFSNMMKFSSSPLCHFKVLIKSKHKFCQRYRYLIKQVFISKYPRHIIQQLQ